MPIRDAEGMNLSTSTSTSTSSTNRPEGEHDGGREGDDIDRKRHGVHDQELCLWWGKGERVCVCLYERRRGEQDCVIRYLVCVCHGEGHGVHDQKLYIFVLYMW